MNTYHASLTRFERLLSLVTRVAPGEGRTAFLFFLHGFLLLASYQVVKALREAFMLTKFSAETRAYAVAAMALVLMFVVPLYGRLRHHLDGAHLLRAVTLFFVVTLPLFALLAHYQVSDRVSVLHLGRHLRRHGRVADVGLRGRLVQRQERPAPVRRDHARRQPRRARRRQGHAAGGGSAARPWAHDPGDRARSAPRCSSPSPSVPRSRRARARSRSSTPSPCRSCSAASAWCCATATCCTIALFVVLLNWINSHGRIHPRRLRQGRRRGARRGERRTLDLGTLITAFYGNFNFWVTLVSLAIQLFLVSRIYHARRRARRAAGPPGHRRAGLWHAGARRRCSAASFRSSTLIRRIKFAENSVDYSLMNTTRQALFLPVDRDSKYDGKTAIDTFFWRFGDLIQAVGVLRRAQPAGLGSARSLRC